VGSLTQDAVRLRNLLLDHARMGAYKHREERNKMAAKYKVWDCKIVVPIGATMPDGFDAPPRQAAIKAIQAHGIEVLDCFSGWCGKLTPLQEDVFLESKKKP